MSYSTPFADLPVSWPSVDAQIADANGRATPEFRRLLDQLRRFLAHSGFLFWDVKGLRAKNTPTSPDTSITVTRLTSAVLYNPNTKTTFVYGPGDALGEMTCSISTVGAGGRDTSTAFVAGDEVVLYLIGGPGQTPNLIWSKTGPLDSNGDTLGPVLPDKYPVSAPLFPFVIGDTAGLRHDGHQLDESTRQTFTGSTSTNHLFTTGEPSGPLTIGWKLYGAGIPDDTFIESMTSHAGTGGAYVISRNVGTIAAESMSVSQRYPVGILVRNNKVWFKAAVLDDISDDVVFGSYFPWDYSRWVPSIADTIDLFLDPEITADGAFTEAALVTAWGDGNDLNISSYAGQNNDGLNYPTANNVGAEFPVNDTQTISMIWAQIAGVTKSKVSPNFLRGFTYSF